MQAGGYWQEANTVIMRCFKIKYPAACKCSPFSDFEVLSLARKALNFMITDNTFYCTVPLYSMMYISYCHIV